MRVIVLVILVLFILAFLDNMPFHITEGFHMDSPFSMVVAIVALVMITGLLKEAINRRHDQSASKKELNEIRQSIAQIQADIADIKEQIADYIIKTN